MSSKNNKTSESVTAPGHAAGSAASARVGRMALGTTVALAGKVVGRGLQFLTQVLMARLLGAQTFGLYAIIWSFGTLVCQFAPLGLQNSAVRFGTKFWRRDDRAFSAVIFRAFGIGLGVSLVLMAAVMICAPWIAVRVFEEPALTQGLRWFAVLIPFATILNIGVSVTRVSQRMYFSVIAEEVVRGGLNAAGFVVLFFLGLRLYGAIGACIFSFAGAAMLALYYVRKLYPELRLRGVWQNSSVRSRTLLAFSLATAVSGVSGSVILRADRLFLGYFRTAAEVGYYHGACQLPMIVTILLGGMNAAFAPAVAELSHSGDRHELGSLFRVATKWRFYLALPVVVLLVGIPEEILAVLFGPEFVVASGALVILSIGQLINAGTGSSGAILIMSGLQNLWLLIAIAGMLMSVLLHAVLTKSLGMTGAALTILIATNSVYFAALMLIWRKLRIHPYTWNYVKGLAAGAGALACVLVLKSQVAFSPALLVVSGAVVSAVVFTAILLVCGLDEEDRTFIRVLVKRVRGGRRWRKG